MPVSCLPQGPCIVYAEAEGGARFGGFNSEGFCSSDDYSSSFNSFLYCWPKGSREPVVLGKVKNSKRMATA